MDRRPLRQTRAGSMNESDYRDGGMPYVRVCGCRSSVASRVNNFRTDFDVWSNVKLPQSKLSDLSASIAV